MRVNLDVLNTDTTSVTTDTWDSSEYIAAKRRLDITLQMLNDYNVSEEGIGTGLLKVFIGVADTLLQVGNTFKTNIFKFWKDLKRSEIRAYWEANMLAVKTIESQSITLFMNEQVDVPTGMIASYPATIGYISSVFKCLELSSYAEVLYKELMDVRYQLVNGKSGYRERFKQLADTASIKEAELQKLIATQTKYFTDKNISDKQLFKVAYGTMQNLKNTRCQLTDMEGNLAATTKLVTQVDNIDVCIGDITRYLTDDTEVDKIFIEQLARTVRFLATAFDVYGTIAMRQMACEHNLTINYEQLYKKI